MNEQLDTFHKILNIATEFLVKYSFQVLGAIIILIAGFILAKWTSNFVVNLGAKKNLDVTLAKFFGSVASLIVLSFAIIIALGNFGITIAPFVAAISAAAFGASFAIQGPLSNYGAGLSVILNRSFAVGDVISVAGVSGTVEEIKLGSTILVDADGSKYTIPNKHIVGEVVHNWKKTMLIEDSVGISYDCDPDKAIKTLEDIFHAHSGVLKTPRPEVGIKEFGDSSINIGYRYWVPAGAKFHTLTEVNKNIYRIFKEKNIQIPYPQLEVRVLNENSKI